jgi:hypothetical protein
MDQKLLLDIRKKNKDGKGKDEKEKNVPEVICVIIIEIF